MIHRLLIVPSHGHSDDEGKYSRGYALPHITEVDVIDSVVRTLVETISERGVRYEVMPTRKHPGVRGIDRPSRVSANDLVIEIACSWYDRTRTRNGSQVFYGQKESRTIADMLGDALAEWGNCTSFGHRTSNPQEKELPLISVKGALGIRLEILSLNGPELDSYARRLSNLGKELGFLLAEIVRYHHSSAKSFTIGVVERT